MAAVSTAMKSPTSSANGPPGTEPSALASSERRIHIIREIRQSEESYVEKLNLIFTLFYGPLHVNPILDKADVDAIFSNIVELRRINLELLASLREHRSNPGLAFTRLAPFLKFYALYAENFNRAVATLQECVQRNDRFAGFKMSQECRPACQALKLEGFLIMPIQRVPRYRLLLKDLLKHTPPTHPDYTMLKTSFDQICEVASHINEYIRQHEDFQKMLAIQQSLVGAGDYRIIMPGRTFLKEGRLMKVCRKKNKERIIFLFSDQLVYAKPRGRLQGAKKESVAGGSHIFRAALPLVSCDVTMLSYHQRVPNASALLLIECQSSSLVLYTTSPQDVESWLTTMQDAIRELKNAHRKLVDQINRHNSRAVVLTNTMLKGVRKIKSKSSVSSLPLMDDSPMTLQSDYPLRCSVMSQHADDGDEDDEASSRPVPMTTGSGGKERVQLDLSESQDVDDLLLALASIDCEVDSDNSNALVTNGLPLSSHADASKKDSYYRPASTVNGVDSASAVAGRSGLTKPVEKFSRNGAMSVHQVTASQSTSSERQQQVPPVTEHQSVTGARQDKLAGQGPSFRRRPPTKESRDRYRQNKREDTPSPDQWSETAGYKSHTLVRPAEDEGDCGEDKYTKSLDRKQPLTSTGTGLSQGQRSASVSVDQNAGSRHIDVTTDAVPNSDYRPSRGATPEADRQYQPSPDSDQDQRGTLRKQKQVIPAKQPLKIVTTDSGRLVFDESEPIWENSAAAASSAHADMGSCNDRAPLLDGIRRGMPPQGHKPSQQPPDDDPVTDLGCGGFRTTTYSFETNAAQSRLCSIL